MLTIVAISSGGAGYYEKDDHHFGRTLAEDFESVGDSPGAPNLTWGGVGAERLGLKGAARRLTFERLSPGAIPIPMAPRFPNRSFYRARAPARCRWNSQEDSEPRARSAMT